MHKKNLRSLLRHTEGAAAIEYAFVLPILLFLILGIVEYSMVMYGTAVLEGATTYAARVGKTGYVNSGTTGTCPSPAANNPQSQAAYINCIVGSRVAGLLNPSKLQVSYVDTGSGSLSSSGTTPSFSNCTNTVSTPQTTPLCSESTQNAGDIVIYTVSYPWPILTPGLKNVIGTGTGGIYMLTSSAIVKNEPYSPSSR